jgi:hypothetical protein
MNQTRKRKRSNKSLIKGQQIEYIDALNNAHIARIEEIIMNPGNEKEKEIVFSYDLPIQNRNNVVNAFVDVFKQRENIVNHMPLEIKAEIDELFEKGYFSIQNNELVLHNNKYKKLFSFYKIFLRSLLNDVKESKVPKVKTAKVPKVKTVKVPKVKTAKEPKVKTVKVKEPKAKEPKVKTVKEPKEPKVKTIKKPKQPKVKMLKEDNPQINLKMQSEPKIPKELELPTLPEKPKEQPKQVPTPETKRKKRWFFF